MQVGSTSPHDSEKYASPKRRISVGGSDLHNSDNRESDFMTKNGLNLRSFQRSRSFLVVFV